MSHNPKPSPKHFFIPGVRVIDHTRSEGTHVVTAFVVDYAKHFSHGHLPGGDYIAIRDEKGGVVGATHYWNLEIVPAA